MKIPVLRSVLGGKIWSCFIGKKYGKFDLLHIHGLNRIRGNIGLGLRKRSDRIAISVWGDEIFRKDAKTLKKYQKYYDIASVISVSTKAMREAFLNAYGNRYTEKLSLNKFAIGEFDFIDHAKTAYSRKELV